MIWASAAMSERSSAAVRASSVAMTSLAAWLVSGSAEASRVWVPNTRLNKKRNFFMEFTFFFLGRSQKSCPGWLRCDHLCFAGLEGSGAGGGGGGGTSDVAMSETHFHVP